MRRTLVWITLFYMAGILVGRVLDFPLTAVSVITGISLLAALIGYWLKWPGNRFLIIILLFCAGLLITGLDLSANKTDLTGEISHQVTLKGVVVQEPQLKGKYVQYQVMVDTVSNAGGERAASGKILLMVKTEEIQFSYGDYIEFRGLLEKPDTAGNPGEFDYRGYLEKKGIGLTMRLWGNDDIKLLAREGANPIVGLALRAKSNFIKITDKTLSPREAGVVKGIVFGVTSGIEPQIQELFQRTGVVHILSVSGFHVALVLAVVLGLGQWCHLPKRVNAIVAIFILLFYGVMTGLGPAVTRSLIMGMIVLLADVLERERDWPTSLALAALIILLKEPLALFDAGFQLSFTATWAILNLTPWLDKKLERVLPNKFRSIITVPIAAQLGTWPLVAYYFNLFSPVSVLANIFAVPLTSLILVLGFGAALLGQLYLPLATLINYSTGALTDLFLFLIKLFSYLPGSSFDISTPSLGLVVLWFALLLVMVNGVKNKGFTHRVRRFWQVYFKKTVIGLLVVLALGIWSSLIWASPERLKVTFIDVGEGDSIFIETPRGKNILIDTGPGNQSYNAGEKIVIPYLRQLGVTELDLMVLTHPHEDHIGGALSVLKAIPVKMVMISPAPGDGNSYEAILNRVRADHIPLYTGLAGTGIELDQSLNFKVISPVESIKGTYSDLNNNSVVLKLDYGKYSFLLTGDIEKEAILELMTEGANLKATIFKLPHHGSKNSLVDQFYPEVSAGYGVICVGPNRFGHPSPETLYELKTRGIRVLRTDRDGAVTFITDGRQLNVDTFRKGVP